MRKLSIPLAAALLALSLSPDVAVGDGVAGHYRVTRERGVLAAASVTGTTAGTANTVVTTTKDTVLVSLESTLDAPTVITHLGADFKILPAGNVRIFDVKADGVAFGPGAWGVRLLGASATTGYVEVVALPQR